MTDFETALHRKGYDIVIDCDNFRMSALILESATDEELIQIRNIMQSIARRYKAGKAVRS